MMKMFRVLNLKFWIGLIFMILLVSEYSCSDPVDYYKAESDLIKKLLDGYNPNIRPKEVTNGTLNADNFTIHVALSLNAVMGIDEIEETMSTSMVFTMLWFDEKLSWKPEEHQNITQIYLRTAEVWRPVWFVANSVERESETAASKEWVPILYRANGMAMWQDQLPLKTACDVDTTFYPFDQQSCSVLLQWYEYELDVNIVKEDQHLHGFRENALWDLYNYTMHTQKRYPDFTLTYKFNRKPDHTIFNVLFPVMTIALLAPLVFLLPAESGERTGYIITVLLSVSVYMIIISDQLPRSSSPMSLLTYVLFAWYVLCALIVVVVVLCSKIYSFDASKPVPKLAQWIVKCLRCRRGKKGEKKDNINGEDENMPCVTNGHNNANDSDSSGNDDVTWASVGRTIDRAALWIFYLLKLSFVVVFAIVLNMNHYD